MITSKYAMSCAVEKAADDMWRCVEPSLARQYVDDKAHSAANKLEGVMRRREVIEGVSWALMLHAPAQAVCFACLALAQQSCRHTMLGCHQQDLKIPLAAHVSCRLLLLVVGSSGETRVRPYPVCCCIFVFARALMTHV